MANINPTTPQLAVVKRWLDAYLALDIEGVQTVISKNYQFRSLPKTDEHLDESKGVHAEKWGAVLSVLSKSEVAIHELVEAPGKVVLHQTFVSTFVDGTKFDYENVTFVTLVEEDEELKVLEGKEIVDPEIRSCFHALVAKALAK